MPCMSARMRPHLWLTLWWCGRRKYSLAALVDQWAIVRTHQGTYEHTIQTILEEVPEAQPLAPLPGIDTRLIPELVAA